MAPHTILIVDNSADLLDMYAAGLSRAGYRPLTATSAQDAIRRLTIDPANAIVTDLQLGGVEGWTFIRTLKTDARTRSIPIVVLTGSCDPSVAILGREVGCVAVLIKPCLVDELTAVLRRLLPAGTDTAAA